MPIRRIPRPRFPACSASVAKAAAGASSSAKFGGMKVYGITVDYDQIPGRTRRRSRELRGPGQRRADELELDGQAVQVTEAAGRFLLRRHPCYRALLADLHAIQPPAAAETDTPTGPCATGDQHCKTGRQGHPRQLKRSGRGSARVSGAVRLPVEAVGG